MGLLFPIVFSLFKLFRYTFLKLKRTKPVESMIPERRRFLLRTGAAVGTTASLGLFMAGIRTRLLTTRVEVPIPNLPSELEGFTIIHMSDLHQGPPTPDSLIRSAVDTANRLKGDVVVITGDLIDFHRDDIERCAHNLSRLKGPSTYAVLGNHDHYLDTENIIKALVRKGIILLHGRSAVIRRGRAQLHLAGLDDPVRHLTKNSLRACIRSAYSSEKNPNALRVLLAHNPSIFKAAAQEGIPLTLAGHFHGGQINLLGAFIKNEPAKIRRNSIMYRYGLYGLKDSLLYVTSGVGATFLPIRLYASPEVAQLVLKRA